MSSMLRIPARCRSDLEGGLKHNFFRNKIDSTSQIDFGQRKRDFVVNAQIDVGSRFGLDDLR
jgi:hypothetical protein